MVYLMKHYSNLVNLINLDLAGSQTLCAQVELGFTQAEKMEVYFIYAQTGSTYNVYLRYTYFYVNDTYNVYGHPYQRQDVQPIRAATYEAPMHTTPLAIISNPWIPHPNTKCAPQDVF